MPIAGTARVIVDVPRSVHVRAKTIAKHFCSTLSNITREGFTIRVEQLEAKRREEDDQQQRDKLKEKLRKKDQNRLAPKEILVELADLDEKTPEIEDWRPVYEPHAKRIYAALNSPTEKRLRVAEALSEVKRYYPLTYPKDEIILARLEKIIIEMRATQPQPAPAMPAYPVPSPVTSPPTFGEAVGEQVARAIDDFTGKALDVSKINTHGKVEETEK